LGKVGVKRRLGGVKRGYGGLGEAGRHNKAPRGKPLARFCVSLIESLSVSDSSVCTERKTDIIW